MSHGVLQGTVWTKHEKEKDLLRMAGGSWSINLDELPEEALVIKYVTEKNIYSIDVMNAMVAGFERMLGGERKLVVPADHWKKEQR